MIAVILSELRSWRLRASKYSLAVLIIILSIVSVITLLKPVFCFQSITAFLIWVGWLSGKQSWSEIKYDEWINQVNISVKSLLIGKMLSLVFIVSFFIFFISPIFVLSMMMRGITMVSFLWVILFMIFSALISLCLTFLFSWIEYYNYEFFGTTLVISWIAITTFFPSLYFINPIIQVHNIFTSESIINTLPSMIVYLFFIILFSSLTGFFLNRKNKGLIDE